MQQPVPIQDLYADAYQTNIGPFEVVSTVYVRSPRPGEPGQGVPVVNVREPLDHKMLETYQVWQMITNADLDKKRPRIPDEVLAANNIPLNTWNAFWGYFEPPEVLNVWRPNVA